MLIVKKRDLIKKAISMLLVACLMILNMTMIVPAATSDESYAANQLKQLGVLTGYPDGTMRLDQSITRSEVATIMVRIRGYEDTEVSGSGKEFTDVATSYWAYDNIEKAYKLGMIQGYTDGSFQPLENITYQEVVAVMVNALDMKDDIEGEWPDNYLNLAKDVGIIDSDSSEDPTEDITRGQMALIVWDTLLVKLQDTSILE